MKKLAMSLSIIAIGVFTSLTNLHGTTTGMENNNTIQLNKMVNGILFHKDGSIEYTREAYAKELGYDMDSNETIIYDYNGTDYILYADLSKEEVDDITSRNNFSEEVHITNTEYGYELFDSRLCKICWKSERAIDKDNEYYNIIIFARTPERIKESNYNSGFNCDPHGSKVTLSEDYKDSRKNKVRKK